MKDYLENELEIGDNVIFIVPKYQEFSKGVITRMTNKMIFITHEMNPRGETVSKQFPSEVIKINK